MLSISLQLNIASCPENASNQYPQLYFMADYFVLALTSFAYVRALAG